MVFVPQFGKLVRRAIAAGGGTPILPVLPPVLPPVLAPAAATVPASRAIPAGWQSLSWPYLRSLASSLSEGDPVKNKDDAIRVISAELTRRAL